MAASISAVAAICASAPTITQGQKTTGGRGSACPSASSTPARKTSANGKPNRKRTWVAPTVPSFAVSSRCVALRTVCAAAAMTVNSAHQPVSDTPTRRNGRFNPPSPRPPQAIFGMPPSLAQTRHDPSQPGIKAHEQQTHRLHRPRPHGSADGANLGAVATSAGLRHCRGPARHFAQTHDAHASLAEVGTHADIVITMLPTGREVATLCWRQAARSPPICVGGVVRHELGRTRRHALGTDLTTAISRSSTLPSPAASRREGRHTGHHDRRGRFGGGRGQAGADVHGATFVRGRQPRLRSRLKALNNLLAGTSYARW